MRFRVGEPGELGRGVASLRVSRGGLGLEGSFSESEPSSWSPKSLRSRWDVVAGLEAGDGRGRFFSGSGGVGLVPGGGWEWLGVAGGGWEWLGVAWVTWAAWAGARAGTGAGAGGAGA